MSIEHAGANKRSSKTSWIRIPILIASKIQSTAPCNDHVHSKFHENQSKAFVVLEAITRGRTDQFSTKTTNKSMSCRQSAPQHNEICSVPFRYRLRFPALRCNWFFQLHFN